MRKTVLAFALFFAVACGPGQEGPPGTQGPKGDPGSSGVGLTTRTVCYGTQLFGSTAITPIHLRYNFADGSTYLECAIEPTNGGRIRRDSLPIFLKSTDPESSAGDCSVRHDVDTADGSGAGNFVFRAMKGAALATATYQDDPSIYGGTVISLNCETR